MATETGKRRTIRASEADLIDGTIGACLACGEFQDCCEPDARRYCCESCGERAVYGLEELLVMGRLVLSDEDGDGEGEGE